MNLRDVPDNVYAALADAAEVNRQSLSAFVVDRLTEVAQVSRLDDFVASYRPPQGSGGAEQGKRCFRKLSASPLPTVPRRWNVMLMVSAGMFGFGGGGLPWPAFPVAIAVYLIPVIVVRYRHNKRVTQRVQPAACR